MALAHVERLDHLGLIASLIKDVGLIGMIDTRLVIWSKNGSVANHRKQES
jgi:hypothetical protein